MKALNEYIELTNRYGISANELLNIYNNKQENSITKEKLIQLSDFFMIIDKYVKDFNFNYAMKSRAYFIAEYGSQDCIIKDKKFISYIDNDNSMYEMKISIKEENKESIEICSSIKNEDEIVVDKYIKKPGGYSIRHVSSGFNYVKNYNNEGIELSSLISYKNECNQNISEYLERTEDNKIIKILGNGDKKKYFVGKELLYNKQIVLDNIKFKKLEQEQENLNKSRHYI